LVTYKYQAMSYLGRTNSIHNFFKKKNLNINYNLSTLDTSIPVILQHL
jgi:hypothetical protein